MDEKTVIKRCQNGDKAAFDELIRYFYPYVSKYLLKITANPDITEDLTQETFVKIIRTIETYNVSGRAKFATYIITVAKNCYIDYIRKHKEIFEDITDVLLLDDKNNILYSANKTNLAWDSVFELKNSSDKDRFLVSDKNSDIAFRFVKKNEFMLSAVFAEKFPEIRDEYDESHFYLNNFQNKKVYIISFIKTGASGNKVYVISNPLSVQYGIPVLKAAACAAILLFMIYWIIIALWVYQNALKSRLYAPVWGIAVLFTNIVGVLIYIIYKSVNGVCAFCGTVQSKTNLFCSHCGRKIGISCDECGRMFCAGDNFCPKCGNKIKQ